VKLYIKTGSKKKIERIIEGRWSGFVTLEVMVCKDKEVADPGNSKNWHEIQFVDNPH